MAITHKDLSDLLGCGLRKYLTLVASGPISSHTATREDPS